MTLVLPTGRMADGGQPLRRLVTLLTVVAALRTDSRREPKLEREVEEVATLEKLVCDPFFCRMT